MEIFVTVGAPAVVVVSVNNIISAVNCQRSALGTKSVFGGNTRDISSINIFQTGLFANPISALQSFDWSIGQVF